MDLNIQQLQNHLNNEGLAPVYLLSGDEPLQIEESLSLIRAKARDQGYIERQVLHAERSFDWSQVTEQSSNMSLFGDKKIVELRLPTGKPGTAGAKALQEYCQQLTDDVLLIIQSGKIEKAALKSKWVQAISRAGVFMRIWPLTGMELLRWIQARLKSEQLSDDRQTAEYIASRVEGNMLAAAQEIEKMALLALTENNTSSATENASSSSPRPWVSNQTHYNVFDLVDTILAGQRSKVIKILAQFQRESFAPNLVLWGLAELIRAVIYSAKQNRGLAKGVQNAFYYSKRNQLGAHANKFNRQQLYSLLMKCGQLDQMIKGRATGDVWQSFADVALKLAR